MDGAFRGRGDARVEISDKGKSSDTGAWHPCWGLDERVRRKTKVELRLL